MHRSALLHARSFFQTYAPGLRSDPRPLEVVEIGARAFNGSIRDVCPAGVRYTGVDVEAGDGVDLVLEDPYRLPMRDASVDAIVSSSCLEHSEMFWVLFLEAMRVLAPHGLLYLNVPSNGDVHRFPVDCWRFYPDSGRALVAWGRRNGLACVLLESYIGPQQGDIWNDFVAVFLKDEACLSRHPARILDTLPDFHNGCRDGMAELLRPRQFTEDRLRRIALRRQLRAVAPQPGPAGSRA